IVPGQNRSKNPTSKKPESATATCRKALQSARSMPAESVFLSSNSCFAAVIFRRAMASLTANGADVPKWLIDHCGGHLLTDHFAIKITLAMNGRSRAVELREVIRGS